MEIRGRQSVVAMTVDELPQRVAKGLRGLRVIVVLAVGERLELVHQAQLAGRQGSTASRGRFPQPPLHLSRIGIEIAMGVVAQHGGQIGLTYGRCEHLLGNRPPQEWCQPGRFLEPPRTVQPGQQGQFGGDRFAGNGRRGRGRGRRGGLQLAVGLRRNPDEECGDDGHQAAEENDFQIAAESAAGHPPALRTALDVGPYGSGSLPIGRIDLGTAKMGAARRRPGLVAGHGGDHLGQFFLIGEFGQSLGHFRRNRVALARILGQHRLVNVFQVRRAGHLVLQVGAILDQRRDGGHDVGHELLAAAVVGRVAVGRLSREQEVERATQAVDVRADVGRDGVLPLFGRHVVDRAHGRAGLRQAVGRSCVADHGYMVPAFRMKLGQSQVQELHLAAAGEHQVGRLDVAMHQLMFVGMLEPQGRLADDLAGRSHSQGTARRRANADELLQIDAVDELHHQKLDAAGLARVVSPHDVRMIQPSDRLHLAAEAGDRLIVVQITMGKDFQGHRLVEEDLPSLVDDTHAAAAQFLQQFVVAQAARFDDPAKDALDQVRALGKSAAVLFKLQKGPAALAEVQFDLQQFPQQAVALAGRGLEQDLFDQRGIARLARLLELVAHLVDAAGCRNR